MIVLFWILAGIAIVIACGAALLLFAAITGRADPTDHGNIVVFQMGLGALGLSAIPAALAAFVKLVFLS